MAGKEKYWLLSSVLRPGKSLFERHYCAQQWKIAGYNIKQTIPTPLIKFTQVERYIHKGYYTYASFLDRRISDLWYIQSLNSFIGDDWTLILRPTHTNYLVILISDRPRWFWHSFDQERHGCWALTANLGQMLSRVQKFCQVRTFLWPFRCTAFVLDFCSLNKLFG